jgi:hypothetical protein
MMATRLYAVASLSILGLTAPALAHHSHASYDITKWVLLEGTVKQVVLIAPHSILYLDVTDESGDTAIWALEATAPAGVFNNGVKREDVRAGDKVKARCHLLRDGGNGCLLGFITPLHGDAARGDGVEREWD